jgi:PAS domain S-box-containing protein
MGDKKDLVVCKNSPLGMIQGNPISSNYELSDEPEEVDKELEGYSVSLKEKPTDIEIFQDNYQKEFYKTLFDNVLEGILVLDFKGTVLFANNGIAKIMGFSSPEEGIGKNALDFVDKKYHRRVIKDQLLVKIGKGGFLDEYELIIKDGKKIWVEGLGTKIKFRGKTANVVFLRDITDRKEAMQSCQKIETEFHLLYEYAPVPYYTLTGEGMILNINRIWYKTLGFKKEEVIGKHLFDFIDPLEKDEAITVFKEKTGLNKLYTGGHERTFITKDGERKIFTIHYFSPHTKEKDELVIFSTLEDTTERRKMEGLLKKQQEELEQKVYERTKELQDKNDDLKKEIATKEDIQQRLVEAEERYQSLFNRSLDCLYVHDFKGNILDANPSALKLLGYEREDIKNINFRKLLGVDQLPKAFGVVREIKKEGYQKKPTEFRLKCKDGQYLYLETIGSLICHAGKPKAVLGVGRDITERKEIEEENANLLDEARERAVELEKLAQTAVEFTELASDADVYSFTCEKVKEFVSNGVVAVDSIEESEQSILRIHKILGISKKKLNQINALLGKHALHEPIDGMPEEVKASLLSGNLTRIKGGVYELFFGKVPKSVCNSIEKSMKIKALYSIGLKKRNHLYGNVVIICFDNTKFNKNSIETVVNQASAVLARQFAENKVRENEYKLRNLVETSPDAITVTDVTGAVIEWNKTAEEITGISREKALGKNILSFYPKDVLEDLQKLIEKVIQKGSVKNVQTKIKKKDGTLADINISLSVLRNSNSEINGIVGVSKDFTVIKKAERKLMESENKFKTLFHSAGDPIFLHDFKGHVYDANEKAQRRYGYTAEEFKTMTFYDFETPDQAAHIPNRLKSLRKNGEIMFETVHKTKNGEELPVEVNSTLFEFQGKPMGLTLCRDITDRKKAEEKIKRQNLKLKKLDRIKSEFLNITSHELRTPMSAIKGYVQMALTQTLGHITSEQEQALKVVLRNTDRLDNLIRDILDISRLESGTMKFIPEITNINDMLKEAVDTMKPAADIKQISLTLKVDESVPTLKIDQERIKQVLVNVINNGIKFSPDGSKIQIQACKKQSEIVFSIQDFGKGIPKDKQKKVFETFYQVDSGMDRKFGGVGLGLAISRGIVVSHGGKIGVRSTLGKGSTFYFSLPLKSVTNLEDRFKEVDIFGLDDGKS